MIPSGRSVHTTGQTPIGAPFRPRCLAPHEATGSGRRDSATPQLGRNLRALPWILILPLSSIACVDHGSSYLKNLLGDIETSDVASAVDCGWEDSAYYYSFTLRPQDLDGVVTRLSLRRTDQRANVVLPRAPLETGSCWMLGMGTTVDWWKPEALIAPEVYVSNAGQDANSPQIVLAYDRQDQAAYLAVSYP